jgi:hypothetical protein
MATAAHSEDPASTPEPIAELLHDQAGEQVRTALVTSAITSILSRPEIVKGMAKADIEPKMVERTLSEAAERAARDLGQRFAQLRDLEASEAAARARLASGKRLSRLAIGLLVAVVAGFFAISGLALVGLGGLGLAVIQGHPHWELSWFEPERLGLSVGAWVVVFLVFAGIQDAAEKRTKSFSAEDLAGLESQRTAAHKQVMSALVDEWLLPRATKLINDRIEPSFDTRLAMSSAGALSSPLTAKFEVPSRAREVIERRLRLWQTGSLGIAGPRGIGKSTLIEALCSSEAKYGERSLIPVLASAPVKYEPRDFILHLFSSLCESVLRAYRQEIPHRLDPLDGSDANSRRWAARSKRWIRFLGADLRRDDREAPTDDDAVVRLALGQLQEIRFQQTFTAGWSGSLTTPVAALTGQGGRSLTQTPLTLPEIVVGFLKFVEALWTKHNVIVAIDELDKIASADEAAAFLNDIKGIFGARNCVFLLSVSEEAMSSFERRGLPARDAIDSALDDIVVLDYMKFLESAELLKRRLVGLPYPYVAVCHVLGGGLPRDTLRVGRRLALIADRTQDAGEEVYLPQVVRTLSEDELRGKTRAAEVASRPLEPAARTLAREVIQDLKLAGLDALHTACHNVGVRLAGAPAEHRQTAAAHVADMTTYAYFLSALVDVLGVSRSEDELRHLVSDAAGSQSVEMLARARQAFAADVRSAWMMVSAFRTAWDCESVSYPDALKLVEFIEP